MNEWAPEKIRVMHSPEKTVRVGGQEERKRIPGLSNSCQRRVEKAGRRGGLGLGLQCQRDRSLVILKKSISLFIPSNDFGTFSILVQECDNEQTSCSTFPI